MVVFKSGAAGEFKPHGGPTAAHADRFRLGITCLQRGEGRGGPWNQRHRAPKCCTCWCVRPCLPTGSQRRRPVWRRSNDAGGGKGGGLAHAVLNKPCLFTATCVLALCALGMCGESCFDGDMPHMLHVPACNVRHACTVSLVWHVSMLCATSASRRPALPPCSPQAQIKSALLGLMLNTPPRVQAQLSEALSIICAFDFPAKWPGLLTELVQKLGTDDLAAMRGVLQVG